MEGERALLHPEPGGGLGQAGLPGIHALDSPLCSINLAAVETNIVMVNVQGAWPSPAELCNHLCPVSEEEEEAETRQTVSILLLPWSAWPARAILGHHDSQGPCGGTIALEDMEPSQPQEQSFCTAMLSLSMMSK
ncbi:hypothetical protein DV515_00013928 [Chloebia gouldiae]|uniref:Uncharacterized protein n=1 Tax=Chloebia gouldiae TaxID=44316 RepID=A0A3L8RZI2_CHLGU|nr:hypothetical protein DV515_00013928 [Chloebia gouldiae]